MTDPKPTRKKYDKPPTPATRRQSVLPHGLTTGQEAYCRARAMGMSIQEALAATESGVKHQTARAWESQNKAVKDRIIELSAIATQNAIIKTGLNREWVINNLMKVVERCMASEPVTDGKGNPIGEYRFDSAGANSALRMLGDTMQLFKPVEKKPGDEYAQLTDADLTALASQLAEETGLIALGQGTQEAPGSEQIIDV